MLNTLPLNALAAFEAAARLGNFTRAGEELYVTQAAISQHIRHLEEYLGVALFFRHAPGVRLTPDGERYYRAVSGALDTLRKESARLRRGGGQLAVVAEASFANRWLAPRLSRFCGRFPDLDLRIAPHPGRPRLGPDVDIIIHPGMAPSPGLFMLPLPEERLFPVFGPAYFRRWGDTWKSDRLLRSPQGGEDAWAAWFAAGGESPKLRFGPLFQFAYMSLTAAAEGRGAALGSSLLVAEDIRGGRLVAPLSVTIPVSGRYSAACPAEARHTPRINAFFAWMEDELARDAAEFPGWFGSREPALGGA